MINRRSFVSGLFAPVIIPYTSLMPVKLYGDELDELINDILWYKGKQGPDEAFYYAPYVPVRISLIKNVEPELPFWLVYDKTGKDLTEYPDWYKSKPKMFKTRYDG